MHRLKSSHLEKQWHQVSRQPLTRPPAARCMASPLDSSSVDTAKSRLIQLIGEKRFKSNRMTRGTVEEAQVAVEAFGGPIDYSCLDGKWRLIYTTASDVIPILQAGTVSLPTLFGPFMPLQVGNIYQSFSAPVDNEPGVIENIIEIGFTGFTESKGVVITVKAQFEPSSPRSILLWFEEARVNELRISEGIESLIAPAILPRGPLQQALLLFLRDLKIVVPFSSARQTAFSLSSLLSPGGGKKMTAASGGSYQLTFMDETMLIGRASSLGGSFVFIRDQI